MRDGSQDALKKIKQLFPIKQSADVSCATNIFTETKDISTGNLKSADGNDDVKHAKMNDFLKEKLTKVGSINPVEDFHELILHDSNLFQTACEQLQSQIEQLIVDSFGSDLYNKAVNCITALRVQCIKNLSAEKYNNFLKSLKKFIIDKQRVNFWSEIKTSNLGLIKSTECESSSVDDAKAEEFLMMNEKNENENQDADNLLQELE
ncbi:hypothetical protein HELRODRAFT_194148 [Helobdella robusta]|uniref:Ku C-terminal domain-containing protein n=1 Tax=Helobdella robusta TaxID=6412 RepID=T1FVR5_HELRO|nr:hypothetical protein HELRODRAFT_194148 [Helobdella robusta]ESN93212.1 hypothetical protein HELRODRAFT_194148 [Helobdella robusta]